jgi:hypothetical protein
MSDKIKICYSWIGPKGPILNTELPNLLSFAAVAQGTTTDSRMFWCDSVWNEIFCNRPGYELYHISMLEDKDVFIYPYALMWRIPLGNYYLYNSGILEFSHTPEHVIHQVRSNGGYFLIDLSAEAFVQEQQLGLMHSYFGFYGIPLSKIIYVTGCMNANDLYEIYCAKHNITDPRDKMHLISYPTSQNGIARNLTLRPIPPEPNYDTEVVPEKLFLSWNRRYRSHRISLVLGLEKEGLVDRSYISLGKNDPENTSFKFEDVVSPEKRRFLGVTDETMQSLMNKLPLVLDGETNIHQMCGDFDGAARNFYQNSLVSLVTETNYDLNEVTLTEKSFKPLKEKHPFIILGVKGTLKSLRELGFQTFSEFWPEDYDEIDDPNIRMRRTIEILREIGRWDNEKILDFRRRVKPILEHNFKMVKVKSSDVVAEKIKNIIRSKHP